MVSLLGRDRSSRVRVSTGRGLAMGDPVEDGYRWPKVLADPYERGLRDGAAAAVQADRARIKIGTRNLWKRPPPSLDDIWAVIDGKENSE